MATIITDVTELQAMENDLAGDYELGNDIDASPTSGWNAGAGFDPVGIFTGSLDGKGFTISDLFINRPAEDYIGLFEYTDGATIQDVTLTGVDITGDDRVGALCGRADDTIIDGCSIAGSVTGNAYVGGVIGQGASNTITDSDSSATVSSDGVFAGGFVGWASDVDYADCFATGNVTGTASNDVGGFIGHMWSGTIIRCYATGDVTAADGASGVGGFVGYTRGTGTVSESYALGDVTVGGASQENGGFVGQVNDIAFSDCYARGAVTSDDAGGFAGTNDGSIDNCYSTGLVTGDADCGGLVANTVWPAATDSFWDTETSGQATSDSGTGKTTAEMKTRTTFTYAGWDFSLIWGIDGITNDGYPFLGPEAPPDSSRRTVAVSDNITLETIRNIEMVAMGRFRVSKDGNAVYKSRYARNA